MAAVAPTYYSPLPGFYQPNGMAEHRPSFTAVNGTPGAGGPPGQSPGQAGPPDKEGFRAPSNTAPANPYEVPRASNDMSTGDASIRAERREETTLPPIVERRMSAAPPGSGGPPPAGTPVLASPSTLQRPPTHPPPNQIPPPNQQRPPSSTGYYPTGPDAGRPVADSQNEAPASQPPPAALMSPQKRKRSLSIEREAARRNSTSQSAAVQNNSDSRMPNGLDRGPDRFSPKQGYPTPPSHPNLYQQSQQDPYRQGPPPQAYPPPMEQNTNPAEVYPGPNGLPRNEYNSSIDPSIAQSQERAYYSESQMAEALQRENRNYDNGADRDSYPPPDEDDDEDSQQQYTTYGGSREAGTAELERKRRKRVFSNRTKTGCMTCRRRKKKCDELHPECE